MPVAFVLSGGASLGAAQVGMLQALESHGVSADLIVGTSVGALNGAWIAGGGDLSGLDRLWRSLRRGDVFPTDPVRGFLGFVGQRDHLVGDKGLRRILESHLGYSLLEEAAIPLHVVATDVISGEATVLSRGSAVEAILASTAIPGVLPTVVIGGRGYMDGGVVDNTPISAAADLGADVIYVLAAGYSCSLPRPPKGALALALHAASVAVHQRLIRDVDHYAKVVDLRVVPPLCPITTTPADFGRSGELIDRARDHTLRWLAAEPTVGGHAPAEALRHVHPDRLMTGALGQAGTT